MKKVAKALFLAISIFAFGGLVGCANNSEDNSDSLVYLTETAPTGVGSFAIEGANVVYWDLLKDNRYGIKVERYGSDGIAKTVFTADKYEGQDYTCYVDNVTNNNQLVNGEKYTYRVYSLGGATLNRSVTYANDWDTTLSAYSSTDVTANIPAKLSKIATIDSSKVSASVVNNAAGKKVILLTVPENYVYTTKVVINSKGTTNVDKTTMTIDPSKYVYNGSNIERSHIIPYTGSDFDIAVSYVYFVDDDDTTSTDVPYYTESDATTVSVTGSATLTLDAVTLKASAKKGAIVLTWADTDDAPSYTLYKATYSTALGHIVGDYSTVTIPTTAESTVYNGVEYDNGFYVVEDADVTNGTHYKYTLVANVGDDYTSSTLTNSVTPLADVPGKVSTLSLTQDAGVVTIEWAGVEDATSYELYRVDYDTSTTPPTVVEGTQVALTVPAATLANTYEYGYYKLTDSTATVGKSYQYYVYAKNANGYSAKTYDDITIDTSSSAIAYVGSGYNTTTNKYFYIDWTSTSSTYKVYYFTTDNMGVKTDLVECTDGSLSSENDNNWRYITTYAKPTTLHSVSYKTRTYVIKAYDENSEIKDSYPVPITIDAEYTTYSTNAGISATYSGNLVTVTGLGYNLDNAVLYKKDNSGNSDWVEVGKFGAGTDSGTYQKFTKTFIDAANLSYDWEVKLAGENMYNGTDLDVTNTATAKPFVKNTIKAKASATSLTHGQGTTSTLSVSTDPVDLSSYTEALKYQWYMQIDSGTYTLITGATNSTYIFTSPTTDTGTYNFAVTVTGGVSGITAGYSTTGTDYASAAVTVN